MSQSQVVADFVVRARTFVLLNSSDEDIEFMVAGQVVNVPAAGKVRKPHPMFEDVPHSLELDGEFVPGTLVLRDVLGRDEIGQISPDPIWSAAHAVKFALGISTTTGQASSGLAQRGLSLLPSDADRDTIDQLRQEGRARWDHWRLEQARDLIRAHDEKNEIRRRANVPLQPGGREYIQALNLLNAAQERDQQQVRESLQMVDEQPQTDELAEMLKEKLEALAPAGPPVLESKALVEQLLADPKAMSLLKEQYKVRKHRGPNKSKAGSADEDA